MRVKRERERDRETERGWTEEAGGWDERGADQRNMKHGTR